MHTVVMHPGLQGLIGGGLAGVILELGRTRDDGVAPGIDHVPGIAGRERNSVGPGNRNIGKSEERSLHRPRTLHDAAQERGERNPERSFENATPGQALGDHVVKALNLAVRHAGDGQ
jgi:hypothetical protein